MHNQHKTKYYSCKNLLCIITCLLFIFLVAFIGMCLIQTNQSSVTVDLQPKVFCAALSLVKSEPLKSELTLEIPPNIGITKIYVSIKQNPDESINNAFFAIVDNETNEDIFTIFINQNPSDIVGQYETTLLHPLCVGPNGAELILRSLNGNIPRVVASLDVTVIYCPDYCIQ